jgi:inhibitor of KinA
VTIEITPLGDSAVILRLPRDSNSDPKRILDDLLDLKGTIERAQIPGLIECASAYNTVALYFDPVIAMRNGAPTDNVVDWLAQRIHAVADQAGKQKRREAAVHLVEVPVCFEAEFALDLGEVAEHVAMTSEEVVELYCAAEYQVSCIGFTPGFPFLSGLPAELATPRRLTPRQKIPIGSVAIGGGQTGIYPLPSPGGWNIIGRTPLILFDPGRNPPALLRPGDHVRFRRVGRKEFDSWQAQP